MRRPASHACRAGCIVLAGRPRSRTYSRSQAGVQACAGPRRPTSPRRGRAVGKHASSTAAAIQHADIPATPQSARRRPHPPCLARATQTRPASVQRRKPAASIVIIASRPASPATPPPSRCRKRHEREEKADIRRRATKVFFTDHPHHVKQKIPKPVHTRGRARVRPPYKLLHFPPSPIPQRLRPRRGGLPPRPRETQGRITNHI